MSDVTPKDRGSRGNHPHADRPNWQPARTIDDFLRNCEAGLESYSERRAAKLLGVNRTELWRWKLMSQIPEDLFERLLRGERKLSTRELAAVARALKGEGTSAETEYCPHCGGLLRLRHGISKETAEVVTTWLEERAAEMHP